MDAIRQKLETWANDEGLRLLGIVSLECQTDYARFVSWLHSGKQAGMAYLDKYQECREDPQKLLPGAKAAIVLAQPYYLGDSIRKGVLLGKIPAIAQYARLADYHKTLKKKAEKIAEQLQTICVQPGSENTRVVVDTAPVLERALAVKTKGGFWGKNSCYIHADEGSFFLLGEILVTCSLPLDGSHEVEKGCGNCTLCQVSCPTRALEEPYSLDSNLCLAYWTIEHRGPIPVRFWPHLATYLFGCDICQLVCPYNTDKPMTSIAPRLDAQNTPSLYAIATMDQTQYESWFGGTSLTRAKREGLMRNALIAMTVTQDTRLKEAIEIAKKCDGSPIPETLEQIRKYQK